MKKVYTIVAEKYEKRLFPRDTFFICGCNNCNNASKCASPIKKYINYTAQLYWWFSERSRGKVYRIYTNGEFYKAYMKSNFLFGLLNKFEISNKIDRKLYKIMLY